MRSMRRATLALPVLLPVLLLALVLAGPVRAGPQTPKPWVWPLQPIPRVVRGFEPPASPWGPGHRGVDLAGRLGQDVLSVAAGTVRFAGSVAGRGVVVIDHGALRSTYQPVMPVVVVGAVVAAGQLVGRLELVHSHCLPWACLHLGAIRGHTYVDPLTLLGRRPVVLKPMGGGPEPPPEWEFITRDELPHRIGTLDGPWGIARASP